jgi:hypothetical protein
MCLLKKFSNTCCLHLQVTKFGSGGWSSRPAWQGSDKDRDAPQQHKLEEQILPEQTTEASHPVHARKKATGTLKEHSYFALLRQHYLHVNT